MRILLNWGLRKTATFRWLGYDPKNFWSQPPAFRGRDKKTFPWSTFHVGSCGVAVSAALSERSWARTRTPPRPMFESNLCLKVRSCRNHFLIQFSPFSDKDRRNDTWIRRKNTAQLRRHSHAVHVVASFVAQWLERLTRVEMNLVRS